jgi:hypothetical protein
MLKTTVRSMQIVIGALLVLGLSAGGWAAAPNIQIDLAFSKASYEYNEPIGVSVTVRNLSPDAIFISKGFTKPDYYLEMRVVDPAGRLLVVKRQAVHDEFPDAPPLSWALLPSGTPVRVAACEVLAPGPVLPVSSTNDLRASYDIGLPGSYSAQVQLSARTFDGAPCEVDSYVWSGVLKSETKYFYVGGSSAGAKLTPDKWKMSWKDTKSVPNIEVELTPIEGKSAEGYDLQSIRLNNLIPTAVKVQKPKIKAQFDAKAALASLGPVQVGKTYQVLISGKYKGQPFGAQYVVTVEK